MIPRFCLGLWLMVITFIVYFFRDVEVEGSVIRGSE